MSALTIARTNCILISDKLYPQKTKCILFLLLLPLAELPSAISDATRQSLSKLSFALAAPEIQMA